MGIDRGIVGNTGWVGLERRHALVDHAFDKCGSPHHVSGPLKGDS